MPKVEVLIALRSESPSGVVQTTAAQATVYDYNGVFEAYLEAVTSGDDGWSVPDVCIMLYHDGMIVSSVWIDREESCELAGARMLAVWAGFMAGRTRSGDPEVN